VDTGYSGTRVAQTLSTSSPSHCESVGNPSFTQLRETKPTDPSSSSFFSFFTAKKQKKYKPKFQTHFSIFILSFSLKTVSSHEFSSLTLTENRFSSPKENFPVRKSIAKPVGLFW
jgi:cystathionine beta-lyase/cystathionine gamma-synthase